MHVETWHHHPYWEPARRWVSSKHMAYDVLTNSGRLVCIVLIAVVCDKPAAHKIGGFASHSHMKFCNLCWITLHNKSKPAAFQDGGTSSSFTGSLTISCLTGFCRRTNEEHHQLGEEYCHLTTPTSCKNFVKDHATCYTQLSWLPYFNIIQQVVIDPMHNLFLGTSSLSHPSRHAHSLQVSSRHIFMVSGSNTRSFM